MPRRVAIVGHTARMGGTELSLRRTLRVLDATVFAPVVVLFSDGPLADALRVDGIEVHVLALAASVGTRPRYSLERLSYRIIPVVLRGLVFVCRLAVLLRRLRPDLVMTNSLKADVLGGFAARLTRVRLVWYVHDRISDDYLPPRTARVFRLLAERIPHEVIANSHATRATVFPDEPERGVVVYPGSEHVPEVSRIARRAPACIVGMVGRISPTKGQDVFIHAAAMVLQRHPGACFTVIGKALFDEDDYERAVRALPARLGIADHVSFTGFVSDVSGQLAGLDVFVHASTTPEPFGNVITEAMIAQVPVVAARAGGVPEILTDRDGAFGRLVEPNNAFDLADKICALLDDPPAALAMAERARARALTRFTIERTTEQLCAVWADVLSGRTTASVKPNSAPLPQQRQASIP